MCRSTFSFTIPLPGVPRVGQENCGDVTRVGTIYESDVPGLGYSNDINWYFLLRKMEWKVRGYGVGQNFKVMALPSGQSFEVKSLPIPGGGDGKW